MYLSRGRLIALVLVIAFLIITLIVLLSLQGNIAIISTLYVGYIIVAILAFVNERARLLGIPPSRRFVALKTLSLLLKIFSIVIVVFNLVGTPSYVFLNNGQFIEYFFSLTHPFDLSGTPLTFWKPAALFTALVIYGFGQVIDWGLALEENTRHTATVLGERFRARPNDRDSSR